LALQSSLALAASFSFLILYTVGRTPWTGEQPAARPLPTQNKRKHLCLEWDSNPRSQCLRGRRLLMHYTARPV
jgi:hypothetical protein